MRDLCAVSLPRLPQAELETAWLGKIASAPRTTRADALYCGRGMALAREARGLIGARLFIISAGFGLIEGDAMIAPYSLTVAGRGADAIALHTSGRFDSGAWWRAVSRDPQAISIAEMASFAGPNLILMALSRPYAVMLADQLASLAEDGKAGGLRLFGWGLNRILAPRLHAAIMPYDERLDSALPGTRNDFPQRALAHFARTILSSLEREGEDHRTAVAGVMAALSRPKRPVRPRATDQEVLTWLSGRLASTTSIGRLLKAIRDDGIACEQARFSRLYRDATTEGRHL